MTDKNTISTYSITFWIFLFLFIIGLGRAFWIYHDYPLFREAVYLTSFWNIFNLIIVICCIGALHERKQPEKYYSFPVFNEYIQHKNQKLKIKRLSLSTILVELKGRFKPKTGEKITCFGTDGKISGTISSVLKNTVEIKISTPVSQNNIKYIYGHSERWKNIINHYLYQKRMILLPFYLIKQGLKSTYGAFKTILKQGFSVISLMLPYWLHFITDIMFIQIINSELKGLSENTFRVSVSDYFR